MTDASDNEWDSFVAAHPGGHHEQTSEFGRNRKSFGFECERVLVRDGSEVIGGVQVLAKPTPFGTSALILRGPLALNDNSEVLTKLVHELDQLAARRRYAWVRAETFPTQWASRVALETAGFLPSRAWDGERLSVLVPVSCTDDELMALLKTAGRRGVRAAEKSGVTVRVGDTASLAHFCEMHRLTAEHQGFPTFAYEYFEYVWRLFGAGKRAALLIAYHDESPVAAVLNVAAEGRVYYGWGGMNRGADQRKLNANYLLHFAAMKWAREHGYDYYDLNGVSEFKEKLSRNKIQWPLPLWKFYGPLCGVRRVVTEAAWSQPVLRRAVGIGERRLGLRRAMPR